MVACWLLAVGRWNRLGVFVSDHGLKIRRFWRTRTLPWAQVSSIETGKASTPAFSLWSGNEQAIWVRRDNGTWIETPLVHAESAAVFFYQNWRASRRSLHSETFHETLETIRQRHAHATPAAPRSSRTA